MKNQSIKQVVAIGVGAALFVVIGMISIPTPVPNTSIQLQYAVQSLLSIIFWPSSGTTCWFNWACSEGLSCWLRSLVDLDYC